MRQDKPRGRPAGAAPHSTSGDGDGLNAASTVQADAVKGPRCKFLHPRHLTGCRQPAEPGSDYCTAHGGAQ
jgi:hypothetical protein